MKVEVDDIVSVVDIARLLGVTQAAFSNWQVRHLDFPKPFTTVANGRTSLWLKHDVIAWYRKRLSTEQIEGMRALLAELEKHDRRS